MEFEHMPTLTDLRTVPVNAVHVNAVRVESESTEPWPREAVVGPEQPAAVVRDIIYQSAKAELCRVMDPDRAKAVAARIVESFIRRTK